MKKMRFIIFIPIVIIVIAIVVKLTVSVYSTTIDIKPFGLNVYEYFKQNSDSVYFDNDKFYKDFPGLRILFIKKDISDLQYLVLYNHNAYNRINYFSKDSVCEYIRYDSVFVRNEHMKNLKIKGLNDKMITRTIQMKDILPINFEFLFAENDSVCNLKFRKTFNHVLSFSKNEFFFVTDKAIFHLQNGNIYYYYNESCYHINKK
jgi:hypothetical protein